MMKRRRDRMKLVTWVRSHQELGWHLNWRNWSGEAANVIVLKHCPKRKRFRVDSCVAVCDLRHAADVSKEIAAHLELPWSRYAAPGWTIQRLVLHRLKGGE